MLRRPTYKLAARAPVRGDMRPRTLFFSAALLIIGLGCGTDSDPESEPTTVVIAESSDAGARSGESGSSTIRDAGSGYEDGHSNETDEEGPSEAGTDTGTHRREDASGSIDADSNDRCPANAHEEEGDCYCDEGYVVNDDRSACVRECTEDSDCGGDLVCSNYECTSTPCNQGACGPGLTCNSDGACAVDPSTAPSGSPPSCSGGPDWMCNGSNCGELIQFDPAKNHARWDYPINGETAGNQYRSWLRRDLRQLIDYAAAKTACQSRNWTLGNGPPLGLGDMSEEDGAIPGASTGNPGHPQGTHTGGYDIDVAYYQAGTPDNRLRSVCPHTSGGRDEYHCVASPDRLDIWRTALFLAHLHVTPQLRVIGVDGKVGPMVETAIQKLCDDGWVQTSACTNPRIAYEVEDRGRGWFRFHHHHAHISLTTRSNAGFSNLVTPPKPVDEICLTADCRTPSPFTPDPRRSLY